MIVNMSAKSSDIKTIGEKITLHAWAECTDLFDAKLTENLLAEARQHEIFHRLSQASIGHHGSKTLSPLRGDSTLWLDDMRCGAASKLFLVALDDLRINLNQSLMLGLESVEAHFAVYPEGMAYARHRDRFRDDDARVLSLVCYLNIDWPDDAGGAIRLHLADGLMDIAPKIGTSVIFLSDEIEHEVMVSTRTRYSIAVWFHRREIQLR